MKTPKFTWHRKDLLGIQDLSAEEITHVLDTAAAFKQVGERNIKKAKKVMLSMEQEGGRRLVPSA